MLLRNFVLLCLVLFMNFSGNFYYYNKDLTNEFKLRNSLLLKNINYFELEKNKIKIEYISNNIKHFFEGQLLKTEDLDLSIYFNGKELYIRNYFGKEDQHTLLLKSEKYLIEALKVEGNYLYENPVYFVSSENINIPKEIQVNGFNVFIKFIIAILLGYGLVDLIKMIYFEYKCNQKEKEEKMTFEKTKQKKVSLDEIFSSNKKEPKVDLYNRNFYDQEKDNIIKSIKEKINKNVFSDFLKQRIFNELEVLEKSFENDKTLVLKKLTNISKELDLLLSEKQKEKDNLLKEQADEASDNILKLLSLLKK